MKDDADEASDFVVRDVEAPEYILVRTDGKTPADNPGAGTPVPLASPTATEVSAEGLEAQRVGENWVRVRLDPASIDRGSTSEMAGITEAATSGGGCVVGTPFLATTDVAGDNSFYGVIDVCEASDAGVSTAIVSTDVPLSAVFNYFYASSENGITAHGR